jgi:hypothetical protein
MNEDDFIKATKKLMEKGMKSPMRYVSYKEYKVLEQMAKEHKLDMSGYPKAEFFDEYVKLMKEKV